MDKQTAQKLLIFLEKVDKNKGSSDEINRLYRFLYDPEESFDDAKEENKNNFFLSVKIAIGIVEELILKDNTETDINKIFKKITKWI